MCCMHTVTTSSCLLLMKEKEFLQGSFPLSELWNSLYDLTIVTHGQNTIEAGTNGSSKKGFQGDTMCSSPALR